MRLEASASPQNGEISLPHALISWTGADGRAETVSKATTVLKLKLDGWVAPKPAFVPPPEPVPVPVPDTTA